MWRNYGRDGDGGGAVQRTRGDGGGEEVLGGGCGASADEGGSRKIENEGAAQCGRALGVLKPALAWLCRAGQDATTRDRCWPPRGTRGLATVGH